MNGDSLPKIGDTILIECDRYTGKAKVTYIENSLLFVHHMYPIQIEIDEKDLNKIDSDSNHGQKMMRISLTEIARNKEIESDIKYGQGSLFDD